MPKGDFIRKMALKSWKLNLFMLQHLPMGFIAGLKVVQLTKEQAVVSLPFRFVNKNPFQSIYFAAQSMAAELSSGIMAMAAVKDQDVPVSMLVLNMKSSFIKKGTSKIYFTCSNGHEISQAIEKAIETNQGQTITIHSTGRNSAQEIISEFEFTWTFKTKTKKP